MTIERVRIGLGETLNSLEEVNNDQANFTVMLGNHGLKQSTEGLRLPVDFLSLEDGGIHPVNEIELARFRNFPQYVDLFTFAENESIPVVLPDVPTKDNFLNILVDSSIIFAEAFVAAKLLQSANGDLLYSSTRRDFLKAGVKGVVSSYLALPAGNLFASLISSSTGIGEEHVNNLTRLEDEIHPELHIATRKVRNAAIAYKLQVLATRLDGIRPHIGVVMGAGHASILGNLSSESAQNLDFLRSMKPFIRFDFDEDQFSKISIAEFRNGKWRYAQVLEIPELKEIVG